MPNPIYEVTIEGRDDKGTINDFRPKFLLHDIDEALTSKDIFIMAKKDDRYLVYTNELSQRGCTQIRLTLNKYS